MADFSEICNSCERKNDTVIALFYCFDCEDKLCEHCESFHRRNKVIGNHEIQKLDTVKDQIDTITALKKLSKCATHPSEEIKYLCEDHDQLCCSECAIVQHRKCSEIISIHEKAKQWKNDISADISADSTEEMIEAVVKGNTQQKEVITTSEKTISAAIEDWEREMIDTARQVKTKLLAEVKAMSSELLGEVETREKMAVLSKQKVFESKEMNRFTNTKEILTQQYLVHRMEQKTYEELRLDSETSLTDISMSRRVVFKEHYAKTDFLKMYQDNFKVSLEHYTHMHKRVATLHQTFESTDGSGSGRYLLWLNDRTLLGAGNTTNTLTIWEVETGKTLDTYTCITTVWGTVLLPEGRILVALASNHLLTITVNNNKIALNRTLNIDKRYYGLAYNENTDTILASCITDGTIDILSIDGIRTGTLPLDGTTKGVVKVAYNIAYSKTQNVCYISDHYSSSVVAVTLQGNVVFTYTHSDLSYPWAIALDSDDNLYVSSWDGHVIKQVDKSGKHIRQIVSPSDNFINPSGLAFRDDGNMFAVTTRVPGKELQIYEFK